jgi:hypothetical protein
MHNAESIDERGFAGFSVAERVGTLHKTAKALTRKVVSEHSAL